jgi:hypothetical protein
MPDISTTAPGALPPTRTLAQAADGQGEARTSLVDSALVVPGRKRAPLIALAVALIFASSVLALALLRRAPPRAPTLAESTAAASQSTATSAPAPPAPNILATPLPDPRTPAAPDPQQAPSDARLEVVMLPYGEIFVDGKHIGRAPISLALPAGDHAVAGKSREGAVLRRQIALASGEHRRIVLR